MLHLQPLTSSWSQSESSLTRATPWSQGSGHIQNPRFSRGPVAGSRNWFIGQLGCRPPSDSSISYQSALYVHLPQEHPLGHCPLSWDRSETPSRLATSRYHRMPWALNGFWVIIESWVYPGWISGRSFRFSECEVTWSTSERCHNVVCSETVSSQYHLEHTQSSQGSGFEGEGYCKWLHTPINWVLGFPLVACRGRPTLRYFIPRGFLVLLSDH